MNNFYHTMRVPLHITLTLQVSSAGSLVDLPPCQEVLHDLMSDCIYYMRSYKIKNV